MNESAHRTSTSNGKLVENETQACGNGDGERLGWNSQTWQNMYYFRAEFDLLHLVSGLQKIIIGVDPKSYDTGTNIDKISNRI